MLHFKTVSILCLVASSTIHFSSFLEFLSIDIENEIGGSTLPFDASATRFCLGRSDIDPKQKRFWETAYLPLP